MKPSRRLLRMMKPYWLQLIVVFLAMAITTATDMIPPYLLRLIVDRAIGQGDLAFLYLIAFIRLLTQGVRAAATYLQWYLQEWVGQRVMYDLRRQLHAHLQTLSPTYFARIKTGQLMSRLTGDVDSLHQFLGFGALLMVQAVLVFVVVVVILSRMNWRLTLVTMATSPVLIATVVRFRMRIRPAWERIREYMGKLTTTLQENISGVRVVKAFAREDTEGGKFRGRNLDFLQRNLERADIEAAAQPFMDFLGGLSAVVLIWFGAREVVLERMSLGELVAFQRYLWALIWPIQMMGWLVNLAGRALGAAPRLFEVLDERPEVSDAPGAVELPPVRGHIIMEDVSFMFDDGVEEVLKDISLEIRPGETLAVVGGTGSGKSTFISMLCRFHDPTAGRILIDGYDLRSVTMDSLRRQVGLVLQESFLFSATLKENIAFGNPGASQEEIEKAARMAQAHGFIDELAEGYESLVGERGIGLSGGQKQRVALARALLVNPRILILDEATASVDTETESLIQGALAEVMADRTTVIIAKRLSTVKAAGRILVLEHGRVVQLGTHAELVGVDGVYRSIFAVQLEGQAEVAELGEEEVTPVV
ncbi:MAG TPA: ABC transporter ATP-binding protein [Clostridiales bacterium UBA8153]|nr:ABC transporter ATP-binding protein [Clostridiales bacterium UBA8153]